MVTWKGIGLIDALWISIPKRLTFHHIERPENHLASALKTRDTPSSWIRLYLQPRSAHVPGVMPTFEGLTSDPKQRHSRFVFGDGRCVPLLRLSTCTVSPTGDANRWLLLPQRRLLSPPHHIPPRPIYSSVNPV